MIPNPHTGWPTLPAARPEPYLEAQRALSDAVEYAGPNELARLVDRALARGARIDRAVDLNPPNYEENFLVCAARANKPWAIAILMARGARLPAVPSDGKDLVMDACLAGHAEMVRALIEVAHFGTSFPDCRQKTALHYAALAGHADCVAVLLEHGADPEAISTAMADADLDSAFGTGHGLHGVGITPLMIAAGRGDHATVSRLLAAGARPDAGACSPLIIAATRNHPAILRALFSSGASLALAHDPHGRPGIFALLHAQPGIDCLRIAAPHHDFSADSGGIGSPLGIAIDQRAPAVVALLLGCGASIEPRSDRNETVWDRTFLRERDSCQLLELMAATSPCEEFNEEPERFCELLGWIVDNCVDTPTLASGGLFPSLLLPAAQALLSLRDNMHSMSQEEIAFFAAFALVNHLRPLRPHDTGAIDPSCFDLQWFQHMAASRESQQQFLLKRSRALIIDGLNMLKHGTSLDFFITCRRECPPEMSLRELITRRLGGVGLPGSAVEFISRAWTEAATRVVEWNIAPDNDRTAERFVASYANNWIREALEKLKPNSNPALDACLKVIEETFRREPAALSAFCSSPVAWLRKFENRNHLRPVVPSVLARSLVIELGLPPSTCAGIARVWRQAIDTARASRAWQTPAQLTKLLEQLMWDPLDKVMGSDDNDALMAMSDRRLLANWTFSVSTPSPPGASKRPAGDDIAGESPTKRHRH